MGNILTLDDKDLPVFLKDFLDEKAAFLSDESRFYIAQIIIDLIRTNGRMGKALQAYKEKSAALMLEDAVCSEDSFQSFVLYRIVGDTCLLLGSLIGTDRLSDEYLVSLGKWGYHGASEKYPWKGPLHVYPELQEKFRPAMEAIRLIEEEKPLSEALDTVDILDSYRRTKDERYLKRLLERGIVPFETKG